MKRSVVYLSVFALLIIMLSCSSANSIRTSEKSIAGSWQLRTITTEGISQKINSQVLNEADFNCFVGSMWNFSKQGNTGYYRISKNGNECAAVKRNISWQLSADTGTLKTFRYQRTDEGYRRDDSTSNRFDFTVLTLDNSSMQLRSETDVAGKPAVFIYNFVKN